MLFMTAGSVSTKRAGRTAGGSFVRRTCFIVLAPAGVCGASFWELSSGEVERPWNAGFAGQVPETHGDTLHQAAWNPGPESTFPSPFSAHTVQVTGESGVVPPHLAIPLDYHDQHAAGGALPLASIAPPLSNSPASCPATRGEMGLSMCNSIHVQF